MRCRSILFNDFLGLSAKTLVGPCRPLSETNEIEHDESVTKETPDTVSRVRNTRHRTEYVGGEVVFLDASHDFESVRKPDGP